MPDIRVSEQEYFLKKEKELIEKLKKKSAAEANRKGLAEAIGLENEQILDVLQEMGFDRDTVVLLFLFPLLQVAWTDGAIAEEERALILKAAHSHGIEGGSAAHEKLDAFMKTPPPPVFFERALTVIKDLLGFQKEEGRDALSTSLLDACERVAAAAGGFLGVGSKISAQEKHVLRRVADAIGEKHADSAARIQEKLSR